MELLFVTTLLLSVLLASSKLELLVITDRKLALTSVLESLTGEEALPVPTVWHSRLRESGWRLRNVSGSRCLAIKVLWKP